MISKCVRKNKNGTARVAEGQMRKPLSGKPLPFIIQVLKPMGFLQGIVKAFYRSRKLGIMNRCWFIVVLCLWKHEKCLIQFDISLQSWSLGMLAILTIFTITSVCTFSILFSIHSYGIDKENVPYHQKPFCLVIIFCILLTLMSDSAVKLFGKVWG